MTLKELEIGKSAVVTQVGGEGALRQHFLDMGMIPGSRGDGCQVCTNGRSDGVTNTRVRIDASPSRSRTD